MKVVSVYTFYLLTLSIGSLPGAQWACLSCKRRRKEVFGKEDIIYMENSRENVTECTRFTLQLSYYYVKKR